MKEKKEKIQSDFNVNFFLKKIFLLRLRMFTGKTHDVHWAVGRARTRCYTTGLWHNTDMTWTHGLFTMLGRWSAGHVGRLCVQMGPIWKTSPFTDSTQPMTDSIWHHLVHIWNSGKAIRETTDYERKGRNAFSLIFFCFS